MGLVETYESVKDVLAPFSQTGRSIAHIHVGLAIFVGAALVSRRRMASIWPLLLVLLLESVNEAADLAAGWPALQAWRIRDTVGDAFNTMLWPIVLFAVARLWERRPAGGEDVPAASEAVHSATVE